MDVQMVTLFIQGGSFGLLAYLVAFGLPKERKDIQDSHEREIASMLACFAAEMKLERESTERRHTEGMARDLTIMEGIKTTRHAVYDCHNSTVLHHAVVDQVLGIKRTPEPMPKEPRSDKP